MIKMRFSTVGPWVGLHLYSPFPPAEYRVYERHGAALRTIHYFMAGRRPCW